MRYVIGFISFVLLLLVGYISNIVWLIGETLEPTTGQIIGLIGIVMPPIGIISGLIHLF